MKNILIVDDLVETREVLKFAFGDAGYTVLEAENGEVALNLIRKETVHCLVTDYLMPIMDGITLVREIRKLNMHIPIFVITGYEECPRKELIELKVNATVFKPFDLEEVVLQVQKVLEA